MRKDLFQMHSSLIHRQETKLQRRRNRIINNNSGIHIVHVHALQHAQCILQLLLPPADPRTQLRNILGFPGSIQRKLQNTCTKTLTNHKMFQHLQLGTHSYLGEVRNICVECHSQELNVGPLTEFEPVTLCLRVQVPC